MSAETDHRNQTANGMIQLLLRETAGGIQNNILGSSKMSVFELFRLLSRADRFALKIV